MRFATEATRGGYMLRMWIDWVERAYFIVGLRAPRLEIEFPSEWHEAKIAWVHIGLVLIDVNFSFPWKWLAPDHGQCAGPRYGFYFFDRQFVLMWGQDRATREPRRSRHFDLPWAFTHVRHSYYWPDGSLHHDATRGEWERPEETIRTFPYTYVRKNGEVQNRIASVNGEEREYHLSWFPWLPWPRKVYRSINVNFDHEVGEKSGSWKGGCMGCSYDWKRGESLESALRRMERERKF